MEKALLYTAIVIVQTIITGVVVWFLLKNEPEFRVEFTVIASIASALAETWAFILLSL